jgi:hypothetical protein
MGKYVTSILRKYRRESKSFVSNYLANFVFKTEILSISSPVIIMSLTYKDIMIRLISMHLTKKAES